MKLIFVNSLPTSMIFGEKVDAWWFNDNGFDVEFWDVSPLYYKEQELKQYYGGNEEYRYIGPNHKVFTNFYDFKESVNNYEKGTIFFDLSSSLFGYIGDGEVPYYIKNRGMILAFQRIGENWTSFVGIEYIKKIFRSIKRRIDHKVVLPDIYFGVGKKARNFVEFFYPKTCFVSVPSININWVNPPRSKDENYILFVDESMEYAPDAKMLGYEICNDIQGYYLRMNNLFSRIENHLNMKVIIGASGKYIYPKNRFENRQIIYKDTLSLMDNASLIIGHTSSAIEHNIKCKKPMIIIDDESFTNYKREGFKTLAVLSVSGTHKYMSDSFELIDLDLIMSKPLDEFDNLINDFYKEKNISIDHREIIANTFYKYEK